jgi:hypothetical protein
LELLPDEERRKAEASGHVIDAQSVHPFHRIGRREWKTPGQHFVKRDAERIEIAPGIVGT